MTATKEILHEYDDSANHRIVVVDVEGKRSVGQWTGYKTLAHHRGYLAATAYFEGTLPVGVFRINHIPHSMVKVEQENTS